MDDVVQILAISGSLRAASSNTNVLQAMATLAPAGVTITLYDQLASLPYFNPDLDREGDLPPSSVLALRELVGQADGILISSPEYAHGVPGVLKNALDWLVSSLEFPGKPVALINTSPRSVYAQASLAETLSTMSASLFADPLFTVPVPRNRSDVAKLLKDEEIVQKLQAAIETFVDAIKKRRSESVALRD